MLISLSWSVWLQVHELETPWPVGDGKEYLNSLIQASVALVREEQEQGCCPIANEFLQTGPGPWVQSNWYCKDEDGQKDIHKAGCGTWKKEDKGEELWKGIEGNVKDSTVKTYRLLWKWEQESHFILQSHQIAIFYCFERILVKRACVMQGW